jgi:RHS repeat-associated protein
VNTQNRIADTGYGYDAAGNLTAEPGKTYQWDAENRLVSINNGCPSTLCYTYNAEGRRVRKTASGVTTDYVYDLSGNVVAEKVGSTWTVGYVYLGGQLVAQYKDGTTYFAHKDHLGSTRALSTVAGGPHESYDFLPYGEPVGTQGTTTVKKFTGKERDAESGLDYYGARYYASLAGRFQSPDLPFIDQHLTNPQTWNLYTYARNNPLGYTDPTGHAAESTHCAGNLAQCSPMERGGISEESSGTQQVEVEVSGPTEQQIQNAIAALAINHGLSLQEARGLLAAYLANQTNTSQQVQAQQNTQQQDPGLGHEMTHN